MKKTIFIPALLLCILFASWDSPKVNNNESASETNAPSINQLASYSQDPAYPSVNLTPNQLLVSPVTIDINSRGKWLAFEGELGVVKLYNEANEELASAIMRSKDGNWMTTGPAHFIAELEFDAGDSQRGKLVFHNRVISEEGGNKDQSFEIPVNFQLPAVQSLCFAEKTKAMNAQEEKYSFQFIRLDIDKKNNAHGTLLSSPYGTDGSKGSFTGRFDPVKKVVTGKTRLLAEGSMYEEDRNYEMLPDAIKLGYLDANNQPATLPLMDCSKFETLLDEYYKQIFSNRINTTDRSRLAKIAELKDFGYTTEEVNKLKFLELETDLDNSYETREFLLYVVDPMICGTGGCTLWVINDKGETISSTSVVKLPIYTTTTLATSQSSGTQWKDLYVWSNGAFRQLIYRDGKYPDNASMEPAMAEKNLVLYPERYIKILDYLD